MKFEFAIDLVCSTSPTSIPLEGDSQSGFLSDAVHEQGSSEMVRAGGGGDGEILGSHSITFCNIGAETVMKGTKLLFRCGSMPEFVLAAEICEDLWWTSATTTTSSRPTSRGPSSPSSSRA